MESKYVFASNGQELEQGDIASISVNAALADDRVFQELFRMAPYTGSTPVRGITPPGNYPTLGNNGALAVPNGATGQVSVMPFRAYLGPFANDTITHALRDTRSCVATGGNTLATAVQITPNTSGGVQYDLVFAVISLDAPASSVPRYVKSAVPPYNVGAQTLVTQVQTIVSLAVQTGTGGTYPSAPADTATNYYVPLFFVRRPAGFSATSTVAKTDIQEIANVIALGETSGALVMRPSHSQNKPNADGGGLWSGGGGRAETYMPPTQIGGRALVIKLQLLNSSGTWSHQSGDMIDDSIDWRNRDFDWKAYVSNLTHDFASNAGGSSAIRVPAAIGTINTPDQGAAGYQFGFGQSYVSDGATLVTGAPAFPIAAHLTSGVNGNAVNLFGLSNMTVALYVDTSGVLRLYVVGTPQCRIHMVLNATAQFPNY